MVISSARRRVGQSSKKGCISCYWGSLGDGPLPDDRRRLAGIVGAQLDEFDSAWKIVRPKFETTEQGLLVNRRLEAHRTKQALRSEKARQSAEVRWDKERDSDANASANASANAMRGLEPMLGGMRSGCSSDPKSEILKKDKNQRRRVRTHGLSSRHFTSR